MFEKIALNAAKRRMLANEMGVNPVGDWKSKLYKFRDGRGNAITNKTDISNARKNIAGPGISLMNNSTRKKAVANNSVIADALAKAKAGVDPLAGKPAGSNMAPDYKRAINRSGKASRMARPSAEATATKGAPFAQKIKDIAKSKGLKYGLIGTGAIGAAAGLGYAGKKLYDRHNANSTEAYKTAYENVMYEMLK